MNCANAIQLPPGTLRRKDIEAAASALEGFRPTQLRNLIADLLERGSLERVGRGVYVRADGQGRPRYLPPRTAEAGAVSEAMEEALPLLGCRVWSLTSMNEFLNHQIASTIVFAQVEQDGMEYAFESLRDRLGGRMSVLLRPDAEDVARYGGDVTVAVTRLVSEAPPAADGKRAVSLEQVVVDMFADRLLRAMLPRADYPGALEEMFAKYPMNESAMLRYARRRSKDEELVAFLENETDVRLHGRVSL